MSSTTRKLVVVTGGLSEESTTHRLADGLTKAVVAQAQQAGVDVDVERVVIRDLAQEIATASVTGFAAGALADAYDALASADAVIAVSPTYKASYTGLFKAFWDATPDGVLAGVPVVVAATGGTARHSLVTDVAMRPLFAYMKALTMPTALYAAPEDWGGSGLASRMGEAAHELVAAMHVDGHAGNGAERQASPGLGDDSVRTLTGTRDKARDPFVGVPTMADMLKR